MQDIKIEDLLCREPVKIDDNQINSFLNGKRVLISGAGGSIGSELVKQIISFKPASVILFDRNENNIFFLEKELKKYSIPLIARLGDIGNKKRLQAVFAETKPQIVFHAAANKHVPLCEENVSEAINNNILGTKNIADVSADFKIECFVMISTDKAVNPSSVMGATKRVAELYIQLLSKKFTNIRFLTVRFGNVLGSSGSVVPIFKSQLESGGPLTVTHPDMTRYFMTIPEAAQLVLQASTFGDSGEIFILDMGKPVKIVDLAKRMITLSGLEGISIEFTGIRPGEKMTEELLLLSETSETTTHPKIFNTRTSLPSEEILNKIWDLKLVPLDEELSRLKNKLMELIPEAKLK